MTSGPNPVRVAIAIWRARRAKPPRPTGSGAVDHEPLGRILESLRSRGLDRLIEERPQLADYRAELEEIDPDRLDRNEALAYWINLYNAGALSLAADAREANAKSVLRIPGGFTETWAVIAGESLSLARIEHGKIRRFRDPRVHGALICGSASCPTLRFEPYYGPKADSQLDDQMRYFLAAGGATLDKSENRLMLSRVFLWYGGDFARPHKMPTWIPASGRAVAASLATWLDSDLASWLVEKRPSVGFQPYDWELACSVS